MFVRELSAMDQRQTLIRANQRTPREGGAMFRKSLEVTAVADRPFDDSPTAWMADGNCRNYAPAVFFPSDGVGVDRARAICKGCPVAGTCLEYALEHRIEHGVWGGCSERERRRILKRRKSEAEVR
jgi:WhiB family redox-sensing transcriptional regulator